MDSKLKYQDLIDSFNFRANCPNGASILVEERLSYRWCLAPIDNELNFLPNHIYDEAKGPPPRKNVSADENCSRCGLSFFTTLDSAKTIFNKYPKRIRGLLGYSHIAEGFIDNKDGLVKDDKDVHFSLFEFEGVELIKKFTIVDEL